MTNLREAVTWLGYTYLYERMLKNPMVYGISHGAKADDPHLELERRRILLEAIKRLVECRMVSGVNCSRQVGCACLFSRILFAQPVLYFRFDLMSQAETLR